jgi:hypothetical protein
MIALLGLIPPAILVAGYTVLLIAMRMPAANFHDPNEGDQ